MGLRDYQLRLENQIREAIAQGHTRILVQLWMGGGKTVLAADIIRKALEKAKYAVFLAHRRELVKQASEKLETFGVPHGKIMRGELGLARQAQVASIQTLHRRVVKDKKQTAPAAHIAFIDEAHHATARSYQEIMDLWPEGIFIGLTATPATPKGYGLGGVFEVLIQGPTIQEMMAEGWLVEPKYFAPSEPDLEEITVRDGDYASGELEDAMDQPSLVGDVVTNWQYYGEGRPTVVFAAGVDHAIHLAQEFNEAGVRAEVVYGDTEIEERDAILDRLRNGQIQVVVNCMVLTEGWDMPDVSCCVLARPTKSLLLYLQMVGRVLRPSPEAGKTDAKIIDHAGAVYEHGFVEEFENWHLDTTATHYNQRQKEREAAGARPITCEECFHVYVGQAQCPNCGAVKEKPGRAISFLDGYLGEVTKDNGEPQAPEEQESEWKVKRSWFLQFRGLAQLWGNKEGWAYYAYREKFGEDPNEIWWKYSPFQPSDEVRRYGKYLKIRKAKSRPQAG